MDWNSQQVLNLIRNDRANYEVPGGLKQFARYHANTSQLFTYASISAGCGYCEPDNPLIIAHWACWKIVQGSGVSHDRLYEFALQTMPLAPAIRGPHVRLSMSELAGVVDRGTSLGRLIVDIAHRLPKELDSMIMNEVQLYAMRSQRHGKMGEKQYKDLLNDSGVLFSRLATVQTSALPMLKCGFKAAGNDVFGKEDGELHTMYIRTVSLFGRQYFSEIGFNKTADGLSTIPVRSDKIRGVRFALGRFGLRGLRILYADGSASSWLGQTAGCWFGNARGRCIRDLEVFVNVSLPIPTWSSCADPSPGSPCRPDRAMPGPFPRHAHLQRFARPRN